MDHKIDRDILQELERDSRQSHAQIARQIKVAKAVVNYRIRRMKEKGIITGYSFISNQTILGLYSYGVLIRFRDLLFSEEKTKLKEIKRISGVSWITSLTSQWDILVIIMGKDINSFNEVLKNIFEICGKHVDHYQFYIDFEGIVMTRKYLYTYPKSIFSEYHAGSLCTLNETETQVYAHLKKEPTASLLNIAQKIGKTYDTVKSKYQILLDKGVLLRCVPRINGKALGYQQYLCLLNPSPDAIEIANFLKIVRSDPNIVRYTRCLGHFSLFLDIHARDTEELKEVLCRLKKSFPKIMDRYEIVPLA